MFVENALISIRDVSKHFGGVAALEDVSFDVAAGTLHAIVGENGAGKSTLMKILAGVLSEYDGDVLLRGKPVRFARPRDAERQGIGIIHQELNLVDELSAAANIFLGRERRNRLGWLDERSMQRAAAQWLEPLECDIPPWRKLGELRVGDQQLVEIAKALSLEARILIMDEPTSALTESEVERLFRVIDRLRERQVTILYISHKMDEVFRLADEITVLRDGHHVVTVATGETTPREITHQMVGREIEATRVSDSRPRGDVVLEVQHLSLPWPGHPRAWRFRDVSLRLRRGEIVGLAGLMGAGRTELLEALFGASAEAPQGRILLDGRTVRFNHPAEAKQAGMSLVTEDRKRLGLFDQLSVLRNVMAASEEDAAVAGVVLASRERQAAGDCIRRLNIKTAGLEAPITSLSGGNQQKTIIGRWLQTRPKVLLLDDPTRGVDVGAKAELYRLMDELCHQEMGILVTSSELPELLTLCDRILVLCEGRLTGRFSRQEATQQKIIHAATMARSAKAGPNVSAD